MPRIKVSASVSLHDPTKGGLIYRGSVAKETTRSLFRNSPNVRELQKQARAFAPTKRSTITTIIRPANLALYKSTTHLAKVNKRKVTKKRVP